MKAAQEVHEMPRVAYSLIRWSDPGQKDGDSEKRQNDFAQRWCRENGVRLNDDPSMKMVLDGESALRGYHRRQGLRKKRALADFLDAIRAGTVTKGSILIMENIDRLSREEIDEAWEFFRSILKAGVDVVTETPLRHYTKQSLNDLFSILELKFCMYRAHEESLMKSKRIRAAWVRKKQQAIEDKIPMTRKCPAWVELRDGKYRLIPDRAAIIKRIIQMSLDHGYGSFRIANILTDEGVPCFGRTGKWTDTYVRVILATRAIYGAYEPSTRDFETGKIKKTGEIVEGFYEAVATKEQWEALQRGRASRCRASGRPPHDETNLFTGFVYEASTGERMYISNTKKKTSRYIFLYVYRGPSRIYIPYPDVRDGIVRALGRLKPEDVLPAGKEADEKLRRLGDLTQEVLALHDRLQFFEAQQNDPDTDPDYLPSVKKGIIEVSRRHKEKKKQLEKLEEEVDTSRTKSLGACQSALALLDTPERRRLAKSRIRQLVEAIYLLEQPIGFKKRIVHVQIYLRGGRRVYHRVLPPDIPAGVRRWELEECDFRAGDIGDAARKAKKAKLVH